MSMPASGRTWTEPQAVAASRESEIGCQHAFINHLQGSFTVAACDEGTTRPASPSRRRLHHSGRCWSHCARPCLGQLRAVPSCYSDIGSHDAPPCSEWARRTPMDLANDTEVCGSHAR